MQSRKHVQSTPGLAGQRRSQIADGVRNKSVLQEALTCNRVDVPPMREAGYSFWIVQQLKVVRCCPGGQALPVRRCWAITPVVVPVVEDASIQIGVWVFRIFLHTTYFTELCSY